MIGREQLAYYRITLFLQWINTVKKYAKCFFIHLPKLTCLCHQKALQRTDRS